MGIEYSRGHTPPLLFCGHVEVELQGHNGMIRLHFLRNSETIFPIDCTKCLYLLAVYDSSPLSALISAFAMVSPPDCDHPRRVK